MSVITYLQLAGKAFRHPHIALQRLRQQLTPTPDAILFVFEGRSSLWAEVGRELYASHKLFRQSVQETDAGFQKLTGNSILPHFLGNTEGASLADLKQLLPLNLALTLGIVDVLLAEGIAPAATLGLSLGEIAAVYAAGGISREDAVRVCAAFLELTRCADCAYRCLHVDVSQTAFEAIVHQSPVPLQLVYEVSSTAILCFVQEHDLAAAEVFFQQQALKWHSVSEKTLWPSHTPVVQQAQRQMMNWLREVSPLPLQRPVYSSLIGGMVPAQTVLPPEFWYHLLRQPVLAHSVLSAAQAGGFTKWVSVGAYKPGSWFAHIPRLNTLERNGSETAQLAETVRKLRRSGNSRRNQAAESGTVADKFCRQLNLYSPWFIQEPGPALAYLQQQAPVHYLPEQDAWLVVDYALINHILKQPTLFSSQYHAAFEAKLLGADPPDHTVLRKLLQQILSPNSARDLAGAAVGWTQQLLYAQAANSTFNFVEAVSLPLAQSLARTFIGLPPHLEQALQGKHAGYRQVFSPAYLESVLEVIAQWLSAAAQEPLPGIAGVVRKQYSEEEFSTLELAKLLRMLWIASFVTTSSLLSAAVLLLQQYPHLLPQLRQHPSLTARFVEECLRLEPSETVVYRTTTEAIELAGHKVPAQATLMLSLYAANRSPELYEHATEPDLLRPAHRNLAFGGGVHHCLGAYLARQVLQQVLEQVLVPSSVVEGPPPAYPLRYFPTHLRALAELPVIFRR